MQENWGKLQEENSKRFDEVTRSRIPVEFIPAASLNRERLRRASQRRPGVIDLMGGADMRRIMPTDGDI